MSCSLTCPTNSSWISPLALLEQSRACSLSMYTTEPQAAGLSHTGTPSLNLTFPCDLSVQHTLSFKGAEYSNNPELIQKLYSQLLSQGDPFPTEMFPFGSLCPHSNLS